MDAHPADLAAIELRREVLIAEFRSKEARWLAALTATLAAGGVGAVSFASGGLGAAQFGALALVVLASTRLALARLRDYEQGFKESAATLLRRLENLKKGKV